MRLRSIVALAACSLLTVAFVRTPRASADPATTLAVGSAAPAFSLPGVDGKTYTLDSFAKSKLLLVVFTCNHCPTAQGYEERIKRLAKDYQPKGVAVVAISPNDPDAVRPDELGYTDLGDSLADMKIRARDHQFNFPYLYGGGEHEPVSKAYGPVATPHAFLFDQQRKLRYVGRVDDNEREPLVKGQDLRVAIDAVLAGREPPVTTTKVFGCSTKWSSKREGVKAFWDKVKAEPVALDDADAAALTALRANRPASGQEPKLRLINVWATWCGPCATEFPDLVSTALMYRTRNFELVTVAAQFPDERPEVLAFLKRNPGTGRNLIFTGSDKYKLMEAFDPSWDGALPYTVLVDVDGKVLYRTQGAVDVLALRRSIVKALNARRPWKG